MTMKLTIMSEMQKVAEEQHKTLVPLSEDLVLLDSGFDLKKVRTIIGYVRDNLGEDVATANLVITGSDSVLTQTGEELVDVLRNGQGVLNIVPIGGLTTELQAQITELHPSEPAADEVVAAGAPIERRAGAR